MVENGTPYYTNSSHLPVNYTDDIFSALDIQDDLQTRYTSGTVFHAFLGEKLPSWKAAAALVRKIAENYKLPYYTMSPTYSVCKDHGYLTGEQFTCPFCGKPAEVYSRITGYYRPVQNWNDGKAQEFKDRKLYDVTRSRMVRPGAGSRVTLDAARLAAQAEENKAAEVKNEVKAEEKDVFAKTEEAFAKEIAAAEAPAVATEAPAADQSVDAVDAEYILFATPTCPNCKLAAALLDKDKIPFVKLIAEEHADLVEKFGIRQAPTLVHITADGFEKFKGVSDIKGYLMSIKK